MHSSLSPGALAGMLYVPPLVVQQQLQLLECAIPPLLVCPGEFLASTLQRDVEDEVKRPPAKSLALEGPRLLVCPIFSF